MKTTWFFRLPVENAFGNNSSTDECPNWHLSHFVKYAVITFVEFEQTFQNINEKQKFFRFSSNFFPSLGIIKARQDLNFGSTRYFVKVLNVHSKIVKKKYFEPQMELHYCLYSIHFVLKDSTRLYVGASRNNLLLWLFLRPQTDFFLEIKRCTKQTRFLKSAFKFKRKYCLKFVGWRSIY